MTVHIRYDEDMARALATPLTSYEPTYRLSRSSTNSRLMAPPPPLLWSSSLQHPASSMNDAPRQPRQVAATLIPGEARWKPLVKKLR